MKLEKRRLVIEVEKRSLDKRTGHISFQFRIGPLKKTMATTIGAALRRTLLSLSKTLAITSACGNFSDGNCIREDLFELSLNLQRIHIKSSFFPYIGTARIKKAGPAIITAQDLQLEDGLEVVNPYQYICSVNESYTLDCHLIISSPGINQAIDYIDPVKPLRLIRKNVLKQREEVVSPVLDNNVNNFFENYDKINPKLLKISDDSFSKSKKQSSNNAGLKTTKNTFPESFQTNTKDSKIKLGVPQKLPMDIVLVDPIYSSIQSCGFEIIQTTNSSVAEYEELIKRGVTETEEFLKFVVISRGAIEPASAIQDAVNELRETLSILEPLPHVFASDKNLLLSLERGSNLPTIKRIRENIVNSYTLEILKKLDLKHLKLPTELELFLRREGFVTLKNLIAVPLEFFKRIGLKEEDLNTLENSLNFFGLSINLDENLTWELVPNSLPLK